MVLFLSVALAASAMVTASKGEVTLDGKAAPAAPYVLDDGEALKLEEGATVLDLHDTKLEGGAVRLMKPHTA